MAVIPTWSQFRFLFGIGGISSNQLYGSTFGTFTYAPGPPATISQVAGDFTADGHLSGMRVEVLSAPLNSGRYTLANVAPLVLTLSSPDTLQAEVVSSVLASVYRDANEVESFPADFHPISNLVRSGGFDAGFTGIPKPFDGSDFTVSCNGGAPDSVFSVGEYHWYLSAKSDDPAKKYLDIAQEPDTFTQSFSGSVRISRTQASIDDIGAGSVTTEMVRGILIHCYLYCQRRSDGAIQWVNLYLEQQQ